MKKPRGEDVRRKGLITWAIVQLMLVAPLAHGLEAGDPPDPGASNESDVEPEYMEPDVEPISDVYDSEADPDTYGADHKSMDDEASEEKDGTKLKGASKKKRGTLPAGGRAHRPLLPYIGIDLTEYGGGVVGQSAAQIDLSQIGEDLYLSLVFGTVIDGDKWAVAPRLPLRIRLLDAHPESKSILREQDWDELSDFARILAFFRYGHIGSPIYVRVGELTGATLGHGSFINRYYNTIDIDHYQGGTYGFVDGDHVGGEWLVDNLLDPDLLVSRVFVRPFTSVKKWPFAMEKLKFGATFGVDHEAPLHMEVDDGGALVIEDDEPILKASDSLAFGGLDLEIPVISSKHLDVVPYIDVNLLDMGELDGVGIHTGSYVNLRFTPEVSLRTRVEYRHSSGGYEPNYVNGFYEVQRVRHRSGSTKLAWLREQALNPGRSGFYIESEYRMAGVMRYMAVYANDEGPNNADLLMRLHFPRIGPLRLSFFVARFDFDKRDDFFDFHDTVISISGRYTIAKHFFARFRVTKEWWFTEQEKGTGEYQTTWDYDIGAGLLLKL